MYAPIHIWLKAVSPRGRLIRLALPAVLLAMLFFIQPAIAATWVVNSTGTGDDFPNIQAAISSSLVLNGDTILLKNGTYTGTGNRDIDFMGKNIVVRSMNMNPLNCVINCQGTFNTPHRGFFIHQGENASAWVQKIKIINGYTAYASGAGIRTDGNASPVIDGCIVQNCIAEGSDGGGISCEGTSAPIIQNSQILGNGCGGIPAGRGGGIYGASTATPAINTCTVSGNIATDQQGYNAGGGGIFVGGGNIDFCTVSNNHAYGPGGGIHATGIQVADSDVWSNSTTYGNGGGVYMVGGGLTFSSIRANSGTGGGGLMASGASIGRCAITGNVSPGDGGGGVYSVASSFQGCTISGNSGLVGGGAQAVTTLFNTTIIWGNCATMQANELYGDATVTLTCSCVNPSGVTGAVNYSGGQVFVNPIFCAPAPCASAPTTLGNYQLGNTSQCLPANSPCGTLVGNFGQGCASAGVDGDGTSGLDLRLPGVSAGPVEIAWSMPENSPARITVYDVQGRSVATLIDDATATSGDHRTPWSGRSENGTPLPRGVYFVRLETASGALSRSMVLLGR